MTEYLSYRFNDSEALVNTFDELPLWSAPFGLLLLRHLHLQPSLTILDIGSGTGFPLMELAGRYGKSCKLYGIDSWVNANNRAKQKIGNYEYSNVEIIEGSADNIPLPNNSVDQVVSNLGINNFDQPQNVFKECYRVLKPGGKLSITTNLDGHWKEFYNIFEQTLTQSGKNDLLSKLTEQQEHRGSIASISKLFADSGLVVSRHYEDSFDMNFLDGSAFLNHYFVKLGWLSSWKDLFSNDELVGVFTLLEQNLNALSHERGSLRLTVPIAFIEGQK